MTEFEKKDVYEVTLKEKILELKLLCNRERMPMFIAVCTENSKEGTKYEAEFVGSVSSGMELKNDLIPKFINVFNGFDTVPHDEPLEIEME